MKAILLVLATPIFALVCLYLSAPVPLAKEEGRAEPKVRMILRSTPCDILPGKWKHSQRLQKMLGELPAFSSVIPEITFRKDPAVAKNCPGEILKSVTRRSEVYLFGVMNAKVYGLFDGQLRAIDEVNGKDLQFLIYNRDGNIQLITFFDNPPRDGSWYIVNVARGATRAQDILFLSETPESVARAYERVPGD